VTAVLGSLLIRVRTNLYKMASWLRLITANAVSTFPMNARTSCLFPLNWGINFKASLTLIKSPFLLEGSPLAAFREIQLGESMDKISWVNTHRSGFEVLELLRLLTYTSTRCRLSIEPCTTVSALPRTLKLRCRFNLESWTAVSALLRTLDRQCRLILEPLIVTEVMLDSHSLRRCTFLSS